MVFDATQNLYCTNSGNNTISKITPAGTRSTFVSTGSDIPFGIAMDTNGNFYFSSNNNGTIIKITSNGSTMTTFATGLSLPQGLVFDTNGNLYCANRGTSSILKITSSGTVSTFCSSGVGGNPVGLLFDSSQNLYCLNYFNSPSITRISSIGIATTIYGTLTGGSCAAFTISPSGNFYISMTNNTINKITPGGVISTYNPPGFTLSSYLSGPYQPLFDTNGYLYIANYAGNNIIKVGDPNI